jgi:hypothetical protein
MTRKTYEVALDYKGRLLLAQSRSTLTPSEAWFVLKNEPTATTQLDECVAWSHIWHMHRTYGTAYDEAIMRALQPMHAHTFAWAGQENAATTPPQPQPPPPL